MVHAVIWTTTLVVSLLIPCAFAAPGDLDPAFNGGAVAVIDLSLATPPATTLRSVRVDDAGRIVVAGFTVDGSLQTAVGLARRLADGSPDPAFGDAGELVVQAGAGNGNAAVFSLIRSIAPRPGGGWLATGAASDTDGRSASLVLAVDDAGVPIATIRSQLAGDAPGITLPYGGGGSGGVDTTGAVVVAHTIEAAPDAQIPNPQLAIARFSPDGDFLYTNTFSQIGSDAETVGVAALPTADDRVVFAGTTLDANGRAAFLIGRLTPAGALDGTFADGLGYRVVQAGSAAAAVPGSHANALAIGAGGKVYVAGTATGADDYTEIAIVRFEENGALDATFGAGGIARLQTGIAGPGEQPDANAHGVAVQKDGSALLVGSTGSSTYTEMVVVRFTPDGAPDPSFGTGGVVRIQAASETFGYGIAVAPDGETAVAVGEVRKSRDSRGVVARIVLEPGCAPDSLARVLCTLDELGTAVAAGVPSGALRDRLVAAVGSSRAAAQAARERTGRARRKRLARAIAALEKLQARLATARARRAVAAEVRTAIAGQAAAVATALSGLHAGA